MLSAPALASAAVTLTATNSTPAEVDESSATRDLQITTDRDVASVTIAVDWLKTSGTCAAPTGNNAHHHETELYLTSPEGTTVTLVDGGTNPGETPVGPVSVVFDDAAALPLSSTGQAPASGTFRPEQPLSTFAGQAAGGAWSLQITDNGGADPLCFLSATLEVTLVGPTLSTAPLADGIVGDAYDAQLPAATGSTGSVTYAAVDPADLPDGLTLAADGSISGTPSEAGTFVFAATATDDVGTSEEAEYTIVVEARAGFAGATSTDAAIGVPFTYDPQLQPGSPPATVTASGLPAWLSIDPATGVLAGTPTAGVGAVEVTLTASNGVEPDAVLELTIDVVAGPAVSIALTPETLAIGTGGSQTYVVTGVDAEGNAADVSAATLTSSDASDVVDGRVVTFGAAGGRTITATLGELTDTAAVEVAAAPVPSAPVPSAPAPSAPAAAGPSLPQTGGAIAGWLALVAGLLVAGGLVARRLARR